ncbi:hypothetical protein N7520_011987 [Penicillium odoratum]|uniref:uncharacterized protein n=1 Tax=Penicillium odoratum TaxID=1167516 RepID=UPI0025465C48|nr:uncharacterized protein N7520_011987 [Penicillium odoratum]KAJ5746805.1 hypothetical protein N7520_011987 [Penicillium odoratum]
MSPSCPDYQGVMVALQYQEIDQRSTRTQLTCHGSNEGSSELDSAWAALLGSTRFCPPASSQDQARTLTYFSDEYDDSATVQKDCFSTATRPPFFASS